MPTRLLILTALTALLAGCKAQLQHGLDERDANELVTALTAHGFSAQKVPEKGKRPTFSIEVEEQQAAEALQLLAELKLPRPARTTTRELATQTALIEPPGAERLRQLEALEGDIEQMLESMDGVHSASVELVVPASARPGAPQSPAKASALVRVDAAAMERLGQQREGLARLIAGATEGLRPEDVAIVLDPVTPRTATVVAQVRPLDPWRLTLVGLAALLCVGAVSLVAFVARGKRPAKVPVAVAEVSTSETTAAAKPSPSRPRIAPSAQRKAA
ncbi:MAG: flagellar M-ring protein FliF [Myxococcaceae bacterium]|nr:flagellar M-ring protein FliF [Myxococcaceae bacterium]